MFQSLSANENGRISFISFDVLNIRGGGESEFEPEEHGCIWCCPFGKPVQMAMQSQLECIAFLFIETGHTICVCEETGDPPERYQFENYCLGNRGRL